jgi:hypothetical protein
MFGYKINNKFIKVITEIVIVKGEEGTVETPKFCSLSELSDLSKNIAFINIK